MGREEKKRLGGLTWTKIVILAAIAALLVVCIVSVRNIIKLHGEQADLRAENERLQNEKEALETELKNVNDLDYIEEQTRKQLKMIKPGEVLFVLDESGAPHVIEPDENGELPKPEDPGIISGETSEGETGADETWYTEESTESEYVEYTEETYEGETEYSEEVTEYTEETVEAPAEEVVTEEPAEEVTEEVSEGTEG